MSNDEGSTKLEWRKESVRLFIIESFNHCFELRRLDFGFNLTSRLTSQRVFRAGRHRNPSQAKSAQFLTPRLRESCVHPSRVRSHRCVAATGGLTLRSSKVRNAH